MDVSYKGADRAILAFFFLVAAIVMSVIVVLGLEQHDRERTVRSCIEAEHTVDECERLVKTLGR